MKSVNFLLVLFSAVLITMAMKHGPVKTSAYRSTDTVPSSSIHSWINREMNAGDSARWISTGKEITYLKSRTFKVIHDSAWVK